MKTVVIEKPVRNLMGLAKKLGAHEPKLQLINVGVDQHRTYVYLADEEMQDPTPIVSEWMDQAELRLVPMNEAGADGTPEAKAGGDEAHVVMIEKIDAATGEPMRGSEELLIRFHGVLNGLRKIKLENGVNSVQIGPVASPGDVILHVSDTLAELGHAEVALRFAPVNPPAVSDEGQVEDPPGDSNVTSEVLVSDAGKPIGSGEASADDAPPKRKWWWQRIFGK